ncbi:inositol polyphosphate multikinase-like isoform X2 [Engraulis encrasicolus]|uniref:inositol polyphosphate multikinase-like isoform X2 n=1 Tax=Engraulis encrasicolus TaxID=184585 RepID=UPI002FD032A9
MVRTQAHYTTHTVGTQTQMHFYSMVYSEDSRDPCLLKLQRYLPTYYGTWSSPEAPSELYLHLEDVTRRFRRPCIMDVKIGQRSYDPFASLEKQQQQIRKYPLMEEIGFLVLGMRVYKVDSDSFDTYDQHFGRGLDQDSVKEGLSKFFHNGERLRRDAVVSSVVKVQEILRWFEEQRRFHFYASSLLFVYDGSPPPPSSSPAVPPITTTTTGGAPEPLVGPGSGGVGCGDDGDGDGGGGKREVVVLEYNNNIEEKSLSTMYALHKQACTQTHHINTSSPSPGPITSPDNGAWSPTWRHHHHNNHQVAVADTRQQQPNGNRIPNPERGDGDGDGEKGQKDTEREVERKEEEEEEDDCGKGKGGVRGGQQGGGGGRGEDVEVRMIDFAHVFPGDSPDAGYIYGLKNLLRVLGELLEG